ncbi:hypothetical protein AB2D13_23825, partial [Pseudomonas aeruginosa]
IQRRVTTCGGRRKTQPTVRDGLTTTAREFADARKFCADRLTRIEGVVQATLSAEEGQAGERT